MSKALKRNLSLALVGGIRGKRKVAFQDLCGSLRVVESKAKQVSIEAKKLQQQKFSDEKLWYSIE
jgi:hypothetical protein